MKEKDVAFVVYEGKEKYLFVSYAHKDAETVLPIVRALSENGYRLWYDSGIEAGTEWPEYIEERLMNAEVVVVFMSPSAIESRNCRNEINFALELKKEILVVYLEETTLVKGMRLQLNSTQSLFRQHHTDSEQFIRELVEARILQSCRETETVVPSESASVPQQPRAVAPKAPVKRAKWPLYAALASVLVVVIVLFSVFGPGDKSGLGETPDVPITMSDEWFDFTVEIEGVVYQFPCSYDAFTQNGWTISSTNYSDTTPIKGGGQDSFTMSNNGKKILVIAYNTSGNATKIKDCLIGGVSVDAYNGVDVKLAKELTTSSTVDEVIAAYGSPNMRNDQTDYVSLSYQKNDAIDSRIRFMIYKAEDGLRNNSILVENLVEDTQTQTETNTEKPAYLATYAKPTELGSDFKVPTVKFGGDLYTLPAPVSCFLDNGWTFTDKPSAVKSGNDESVCMERDGAEVYLSIFNFADYQTTPENCAVTRIRAEESSGVNLELPNGLKLGLSKAQVEAIVTDDFDFYEGTYSFNWSYSEYKNLQMYISVDVDTKTKKSDQLTVSCDVWHD